MPSLHGQTSVPGDKSISHRALIIGSAVGQPVQIRNTNTGADVRATMEALQQLGVTIEHDSASVRVRGGKLHDAQSIDCANSGSTARMMIGVATGANLQATFEGDESLARRPMEPVAAQLRAFGARIQTTDGHLPATLSGRSEPQTRHFILLSPSAQVKSALLFAGLYADTPVSVSGDKGSRDHTERLLRYMGASIEFDAQHAALQNTSLQPRTIEIPGDFSSAAFFIVAATIIPGSELRLLGIGINSTRTGLLDALESMGAAITLENERESCGEPVADIVVRSAPLTAASISGDVSLRAIDEIPALSIAAAFAQGSTKISGVNELRVKESDRIAAIQGMLAAIGIESQPLTDGIVIHGGVPRADGRPVITYGDHRIAMSALVLRRALGALEIDDEECCEVSYPGFEGALTQRLD